MRGSACHAIRSRNSRPMFVPTFLLKGGLYQMTFLCRFHCEFAGLDGSSGTYCKLLLKWLRLRALLAI